MSGSENIESERIRSELEDAALVSASQAAALDAQAHSQALRRFVKDMIEKAEENPMPPTTNAPLSYLARLPEQEPLSSPAVISTVNSDVKSWLLNNPTIKNRFPAVEAASASYPHGFATNGGVMLVTLLMSEISEKEARSSTSLTVQSVTESAVVKETAMASVNADVTTGIANANALQKQGQAAMVNAGVSFAMAAISALMLGASSALSVYGTIAKALNTAATEEATIGVSAAREAGDEPAPLRPNVAGESESALSGEGGEAEQGLDSQIDVTPESASRAGLRGAREAAEEAVPPPAEPPAAGAPPEPAAAPAGPRADDLPAAGKAEKWLKAGKLLSKVGTVVSGIGSGAGSLAAAALTKEESAFQTQSAVAQYGSSYLNAQSQLFSYFMNATTQVAQSSLTNASASASAVGTVNASMVVRG